MSQVLGKQPAWGNRQIFYTFIDLNDLDLLILNLGLPLTFLLFVGLPLTFLLGFYVSLVVKRWWEQYCKLPWPDNIAIYLRGLIQVHAAPNLLQKIYIYNIYILASYHLQKKFRLTKQQFSTIGCFFFRTIQFMATPSADERGNA